MALCPFCFEKDKSFFASKCPNCNSRVPFPLQIFWSLTVTVTILVGSIWAFFWGVPMFFEFLHWLLTHLNS
jgi:hypothetical protein